MQWSLSLEEIYPLQCHELCLYDNCIPAAMFEALLPVLPAFDGSILWHYMILEAVTLLEMLRMIELRQQVRYN